MRPAWQSPNAGDTQNQPRGGVFRRVRLTAEMMLVKKRAECVGKSENASVEMGYAPLFRGRFGRGTAGGACVESSGGSCVGWSEAMHRLLRCEAFLYRRVPAGLVCPRKWVMMKYA